MNPQDNQQAQATNPQQQVIERLKTAVNVLITVSNSPSVDQLAGAIGFTLLLNKLGKHATTVFSGTVPSTLEFLKPDDTIEKNTDSLRDFIVSLDKSKADKLRYKVEQNVVKIFITPYHTSITEKDLEFSQGDFNVDVVLALGINNRNDLDQAITSHGRILHDATVITISAGTKTSSLGAINWHDGGAASLCELLVGVGEALQPNLLDTQAATAFLTGIVAETNRFSNDKTTPKIMSLASQLMAAGANQQLIATQLEKATEVPLKETPKAAPQSPAASPDGALTIEHTKDAPKDAPTEKKEDMPAPEPVEPVSPQIAIDEHGNMSRAESEGFITKHRIIEPIKGHEEPKEAPVLEEKNTYAANMDEDNDKASGIDPSAPLPERDKETLSHDKASTIEPDKSEPEPAAHAYVPAPDVTVPPPDILPPPAPAPEPPKPADKPEPEILTLPPAMDNNTLHELEKNLDSPHFVKDPTTTLHEMEEFVDSSHLTAPETSELTMTPPQAEGVDAARDAVNSAISSAPYDPNRPQPLHAVNAVPLPTAPPLASDPVLSGLGLSDDPSRPSGMMLPPVQPAPMQSVPNDPSGQSPPPVPPPMIPMQ